MGLKQWFGNVWAGAKRHAPAILTTSAIGLFLTSTILAVKATPKAMEAIEEKKNEDGHVNLTALQIIQVTWRYYVWSALSFLGGVGCSTRALKENDARIAGLMAVAESGRNMVKEFNEYRQFVAQQIGPKKEAEIHNQAIQQAVVQNPPPAGMTADRAQVEGQAPKPMCFESSFGRYFYVDYETVASAVNKLNDEIHNGLNGYVSLNDFYDEIHVDTTEFGDRVGWSIETGLIKIPAKDELRYAGTPGGWPCWILEFLNPPQYEYQFFRRH